MSESSDNPASEQKPAEPVKPAGPDPVAPLPRAARPGTPEAAPGGQISLQDLMALARTLSASGVDVEDAEGVRGTISREQRKFSRAGRAESPAKPVEAETGNDPAEDDRLTLPATDAEASVSGAPRESALPAMTARTRRRASSSSSRGPGLLVPAAIVLTLAGFIAAVWFVARLARPAPETRAVVASSVSQPEAHAPARALTARANELADKIADAALNDDPTKALALCVLARSEGTMIYGLAYQEARFATAIADYPAAAISINRSLDANEEVSECYLLRAGRLARTGKLEGVLRDYEAAAAAAPFESKPFFFWGESLRRLGRPQAALVRLGEAVARATDADMADFYRFKQRLALVEMDRAAEFADELKAKLALPAAPPDWVLTAAAVELRKGDFPAAGRFLDRAAASLSAEQLESRLRDYFFFGFARESTLARFFGPLLKARPAPVGAASPAPAASPMLPVEVPATPAPTPPLVALPPS